MRGMMVDQNCAYEWGGVFAMDPGETFLSDEEYAALIGEIRTDL